MVSTIVPRPMPKCFAPELSAEPHRFPRVAGEDEDEQQREIKEVAVNVLHDQGKRVFARIAFSRLADGARRRVGPKRFIIGAPIIVARQAKAGRCPEDQKRGRKQQPRWPPARFRAENRVGRAAEKLGRIERR